MTERPILFSSPMVRAILDGRKTVTRRIVKPQPSGHHWQNMPGYIGDYRHEGDNLWHFAHRIPQNPHWDCDQQIRCPYGQPGDRLWVREAFQVIGYGGFGQQTDAGYERFETIGVEFAAGGEPVTFDFLNGRAVEGTPESVDYAMANRMSDSGPEGNRPSIHMPRWASRITLEVAGVRVERLQDITPAQCIAEGAMSWAAEQDSPLRDLPAEDARIAFAGLWNATGGDWDANPWVWAIEFKRLTQEPVHA